jgi:hypothetical protein
MIERYGFKTTVWDYLASFVYPTIEKYGYERASKRLEMSESTLRRHASISTEAYHSLRPYLNGFTGTISSAMGFKVIEYLKDIGVLTDWNLTHMSAISGIHLRSLIRYLCEGYTGSLSLRKYFDEETVQAMNRGKVLNSGDKGLKMRVSPVPLRAL